MQWPNAQSLTEGRSYKGDWKAAFEAWLKAAERESFEYISEFAIEFSQSPRGKRDNVGPIRWLNESWWDIDRAEWQKNNEAKKQTRRDNKNNIAPSFA